MNKLNQYIVSIVMLFSLNISHINAATTVLEINGVNSGWVAQHPDDTTITVLSVNPSETTIDVDVSGTIAADKTKESIVLKQVAIDSDFKDEVILWIHNLSLTNTSGKNWTTFELRAIDGNGRPINALEHSEHPSAAHIHAMLPFEGRLSKATHGLALPQNRFPFSKFTLTPYGYPCDPSCGLGVEKITLSGGVVNDMNTFISKDILFHVMKHTTEANGKTIYDTSMIIHLTPNP